MHGLVPHGRTDAAVRRECLKSRTRGMVNRAVEAGERPATLIELRDEG
jgi:hypothetical protein